MKSFVKVAAVVAVLLIVVGLVLPFLVHVNNFRPQIESNLSSALGRPVKVGDLSFSVFSGSVGADQLVIADDPKFSSAPFIQAKALRVGVELIPLIFSKQLNVTKIVIDHPNIILLRDRDGVWNFSSLGNQSQSDKAVEKKKATAPPNINVARLDLRDGTVSLGSTTGKRNPVVYDKVDAIVRDFSFTRAFPIVASAHLPGGGSLKIDGTAGPVNSTDTTLTPVRAEVKLKKLDLSQSALVDPELGIAGSADFDGTLNSDGRIAKAEGTVKAASLKLVPRGSPARLPVQVVFSLEHDLLNQSGKLTQGDVAVGKALAKLTGTYDMRGSTTSMNMKLNGQAMPVDDLQAMLPALGITLPTGSQLKGGMLAVEIDSAGPLDILVSTGWVRMSRTALAGFNLGSKLSALTALTGKQSANDTVIENLSFDLRHAPEGTRLNKINIMVPVLGTVTGAGTISPNNELDFKMVANLTSFGAGFAKITGPGASGISVSIAGTTSNPTFTPDMKELLNSKIKGLTEGKGKPLAGLSGLFGKRNRSQRTFLAV